VASDERTATHALVLERELEALANRYEFFEALRRLECAHPDKPRVGKSKKLVDDPLRLSQEPSLAFASSTIASFRGGRDGKPARMFVYFLGLFGPNGPLPLHLTEYARNRQRDYGDTTFRSFLDLFHHRILGLFYRAWADGRPTVNFDRPRADRFAMYVGSLVGMATPALRDRDAVSDLAKLHHAGNLSGQTKHAEGLRGMLEQFFEIRVIIDEFVGVWLDLPLSSRWLLGRSRETGTLGRSTVLGPRVWDRQQKFRIVFGPLKMRDYERLIPSHESVRRLAALVRNYTGDSLYWEVGLVLQKENVPRLVLGGTERLGWTTWLINRTPRQDMRDLTLSPESCTSGRRESAGEKAEEYADV